MDEKMLKLEDMLPPAVSAVGSYRLVKQVGDLVYTSGVIPMKDGNLVATGKVASDVSIEEAKECARVCVLNALSTLKNHLGGDLGRLLEVVQLRVAVSSAPGFTDQHVVANGASDFLAEYLGETGAHVRAAFGAASLPLDAPVEIEFVFRVD